MALEGLICHSVYRICTSASMILCVCVCVRMFGCSYFSVFVLVHLRVCVGLNVCVCAPAWKIKKGDPNQNHMHRIHNMQ